MITQQDSQPAEGLVIFGYSDPGGGLRARVVSSGDRESHFEKGLPWTPGNMSLNVLGDIPAGSPYGAVGDARLKPDGSTEVSLGPESKDVLVLCDATQLDGSPWFHCPRTLLKDALERLHDATGLRVKASFEHEFSLTNWEGQKQKPISFESIRQVSREVTQTLGRLRHAGVEPEIWFPEFGQNQHECTMAPSIGVAAADNAVVYREVVRESMKSFGHDITFSPVLTPDGVGNGVHIHISLVDDSGDPVMYDAGGPGNLSDLGHRFATGIVKHMPALTAFTAPSIISGYRMQPGKWSASHTVLSNQNRAAALRICPLTGTTEEKRSRAFNIEYRATDATASPYLALATVIRAGLLGISEEYPKAPLYDGDIAKISPDEMQKLGIRLLPRTLEESLEALRSDPAVSDWFEPDFLVNHFAIKNSEIEAFEPLTDQERCDFYAGVV